MIIGIDPGLYGAIGVLTDQGQFLAVHDMPRVLVNPSAVVKERVDGAALRSLLQDLQLTRTISYVVVERVHAHPDQGVSSVFSFGHSLGVIEGVLASLKLTYELVTPQAWKKYYKLTGKKKDAKEQGRAVAIKLFPDAPLGLKKHADRAEALLLARYVVKESHG
jgi:crossover junction endodeoxyribonuclease RuvC